MSLNGLLERLQRRGPEAVMPRSAWIATEAPRSTSPEPQTTHIQGSSYAGATAPPLVDRKVSARVDAAPEDAPDASCWPHSPAMPSAELDTFAARLARCTDRGLILADAQRLADKLVIRDREGDDRRACPECRHLSGRATAWRCGNWGAAGVPQALPGALVTQPQRCPGFNEHHHPTPAP